MVGFFLLQVDDPWLIEYLSHDDRTEGRRLAEQHVEILNHALRGIREEKFRALAEGARLASARLY
jgi:5-methyltetrahydropteroyltriglutamate--homocysteine methyltransferase